MQVWIIKCYRTIINTNNRPKFLDSLHIEDRVGIANLSSMKMRKTVFKRVTYPVQGYPKEIKDLL